MITGLYSGLMSAIGAGTKKNLSSFSSLETSDGMKTIVAKDGSLASVVRIDGIEKVLGPAELQSIVDDMNIRMSPYLAQTGHAIQVWFSRDPDLSEQMVKDLVRSSRGVAKRLDLDMEDLFSEREKNLPKYITWEGFYMVLWTRLGVLSKKEMEAAKMELKAPKGVPSFGDAQDPFRVGRAIKERHKAFVNSFMSDLKDIRIRAECLDVHEAIKAIKWSVYPDLIGADWRAHMIGDPLRERMPEINDFDASHLMWPRLDEQIFDREAERINPRIVKIGSRYFSSMDMAIGPQETLDFSRLLSRISDIDEFPWRVSFLIEGEGLRSLNIKAFLAAIFKITNSDNGQVREAIKALEESRQSEGTTVTRFRASFATWAPADEGGLRLVEERSSRLQRAVESWGYCSVSTLVGDPVEGTMSSALGLDVASTAPAGAVPLKDVISMLPWNRDASPWKHGSVLFRTGDGRPWPYQPGSSLQDTFIDFIFAPPGKGKSVWLNTANLAMCLSPASTSGTGGAQLPWISIIDVGPSSSGLISLIQEALPADRRHEVAYHRLRMTTDYAINPFDTQLGCRRPLPLERAFLVNFLSTLGTEPGEETPPAGMSGIFGAAIDALYDRFDDRGRKGVPRRYNEGVCHAVDRAIRQHNITIKPGVTCWWDVTDDLYRKNDIHHAIMAQRHAVPRLEDMMTVINDPQVTDVHGTAKLATTEKVIEVVSRVISQSIRDYAILQRPTAFDIGDARIVALDLDEVAPKGGGPADKQTSLMYMLARFVLARDFYLNNEVLNDIPEDYRSYHAPRIRRIRETPKRIVYDEFHRTSKSKAVREQVMVDMREGRKWGVHISLVSQLLQDFDETMVDMATGIWIMGVGNERAANEAASLFGLSDTSLSIVKNRLRGPTKAGAPFLAILSLKDAKHEHLLFNTLGPTEMWAFSTTPEDAALRSELYKEIGPVEARRRLAIRFPNGTAKAEIDRRMMAMMQKGSMDDDEAQEGVVDEIVQEILKTSPA